MPTHYTIKTHIVLAKGLGPMFFNCLWDGIEACARLRGMGYKPRLKRNPNPETIRLTR